MQGNGRERYSLSQDTKERLSNQSKPHFEPETIQAISTSPSKPSCLENSETKSTDLVIGMKQNLCRKPTSKIAWIRTPTSKDYHQSDVFPESPTKAAKSGTTPILGKSQDMRRNTFIFKNPFLNSPKFKDNLKAIIQDHCNIPSENDILPDSLNSRSKTSIVNYTNLRRMTNMRSPSKDMQVQQSKQANWNSSLGGGAVNISSNLTFNMHDLLLNRKQEKNLSEACFQLNASKQAVVEEKDPKSESSQQPQELTEARRVKPFFGHSGFIALKKPSKRSAIAGATGPSQLHNLTATAASNLAASIPQFQTGTRKRFSMNQIHSNQSITETSSHQLQQLQEQPSSQNEASHRPLKSMNDFKSNVQTPNQDDGMKAYSKKTIRSVPCLLIKPNEKYLNRDTTFHKYESAFYRRRIEVSSESAILYFHSNGEDQLDILQPLQEIANHTQVAVLASPRCGYSPSNIQAMRCMREILKRITCTRMLMLWSPS